MSDAGGDCSIGLDGPAREFSLSGNLTSSARNRLAPALADGDHYREMARRVRGLARLTCSPVIRRELVDLAKRTTGAAIISTADHPKFSARRLGRAVELCAGAGYGMRLAQAIHMHAGPFVRIE
jgi:hypothetical protein